MKLALFICAALPLTALGAPLPSYELQIRDGHFTPATLQVAAGQRFKI